MSSRGEGRGGGRGARGDRGGGRGGGDRGGRGGGDRGGGRGGGDRGGGRGGGDRGGGRGGGDRGGGRGGGDRGRGGYGDRGGRGRGGPQSLPFREGRGGPRGGGGRGRGGPPRAPARIYTPAEGVPTPDPKVGEIENQIDKNVLSKGVGAVDKFPLRPGYGTKGKNILLFANYMEISSTLKQHVYRYNTEVQPGDKGRAPSLKKTRHIIRLLLEQHFPDQLNSIASDFRSTLISVNQLNLPGEIVEVRYKDPDATEYPDNPQLWKVRILATGTLSIGALIDYLTSANASAMFEAKPEVIQALNIIVGHYPKVQENIATVGGNKHYSLLPGPGDRFQLQEGLEVLRGYFVSVRAATARLLVNVQVKNIACYLSDRLDRVIDNANIRHRGRLEKFLKTLQVRPIHLPERRRRVKSIFGLATSSDGKNQEKPPQVEGYAANPYKVKFWLEGGVQGSTKKSPKEGPATPGRYITVAEYFKENYNLEASDRYPVVNVGSRSNPSYLIAEACEVLPGQAANTKLSPNQTASMIRFAVRSPGENADAIVENGTKVLGFAPQANSTLKSFGLEPTGRLITVPGRVLSAPRVEYGDSKKITPNNADWNMRDIKFYSGSQLKSWTYVILDANRTRQHWRDQSVEQTLAAFVRTLNASGITTSNPEPGVSVQFDGSGNNDQRVRTAFERLADRKPPPQFVLVILPFRDVQLYNLVKQMCDVRLGLPNACVVADKFSKPHNEQYFANEGLKINLKLGGTNQLVADGQLGLIEEGKTMLVGIDVTHPSPGSAKNAPSVAAMVASVDKNLGQFPADIRIQAGRTEMVAELDGLLKSRLELWRQRNKSLPENIIVYRDGVSEGQYDLVREQELPLLKKACEETYPASDTKGGLPRLSIVVVGKRHHTRFYATNEQEADQRSKNPPNGTIVDRGVTEARYFDFYLQAHKALQGTARPAHYFTVHDEIFTAKDAKNQGGNANAADSLQELTHRLCYLFGRATKAVSVCPPAYYADLVCERARCYLDEVFDPSGSGTPTISAEEGEGQLPEVSFSNVTVHPNLRNTMFYI